MPPTYYYRCENPTCGLLREDDHSILTFKEHHPKCEKCESQCTYEFNPTVVQFALKDGPSGSWPSKGERFKKYRANQSKKMERRQRDRYGHLERDCVPNYNGQATEDWREAQSLAMKGSEDSLQTAATYNQKINKEKRGKGGIISK